MNHRTIITGVRLLMSAILAIALVVGVAVACCSTHKQSAEKLESADTDSLHEHRRHQPPIVIPHSWQEELK